jgi:TPR repeat protein
MAARAGTTISFSSPREALKQGLSAYQGGYYEIAIPALEYAAAGNEFMAEYYLARIYSDNNGSHTDHPKAYLLFQKIADEYAEIDPEDDPRARYVGKALTALAGYVRRGLKEIGLKPNPELAVLYLHNASSTFDDEDAQFEFAKLRLTGEGVEEDRAMGLHWLSVLAERGHAGAQAFLADLLWRGKYIKADQVMALALIDVAVQNAPVYERLWIEDIHQNIFCGAGEGIRRQATGIVASWGSRYGKKPETREAAGIGMLTASPERTCSNGERVAPMRLDNETALGSRPSQVTEGNEGRAGFVYGRSAPELRDVGGTTLQPSLR